VQFDLAEKYSGIGNLTDLLVLKTNYWAQALKPDQLWNEADGTQSELKNRLSLVEAKVSENRTCTRPHTRSETLA